MSKNLVQKKPVNLRSQRVLLSFTSQNFGSKYVCSPHFPPVRNNQTQSLNFLNAAVHHRHRQAVGNLVIFSNSLHIVVVHSLQYFGFFIGLGFGEVAGTLNNGEGKAQSAASREEIGLHGGAGSLDASYVNNCAINASGSWHSFPPRRLRRRFLPYPRPNQVQARGSRHVCFFLIFILLFLAKKFKTFVQFS